MEILSKPLNICDLQTVKDLTVVHLGDYHFDEEKFIPIKNQKFIKPIGGLWTSPTNSKYGWREFIIDNNFNKEDLIKYFKLKFKDFSKITIIDSYKDLENLPMISVFNNIRYPDYELISTFIDAIWLTYNGQWATRTTYPLNLYGWDVETVLILNKNCVFEI